MSERMAWVRTVAASYVAGSLFGFQIGLTRWEGFVDPPALVT